MGEFVRQNRLLPVGRNPVQHGDHLGFIVVVRGNLLAGGLDQKFLQIEVAGKKADLLHAQLFLREALGEFLFGQRAAGVLLHVGFADQAALHGGVLGHAGVFGGEGENLVDGVEELFGVGVGHADFVGRVLAEFAGDIAETGRGRSVLAGGERPAATRQKERPRERDASSGRTWFGPHPSAKNVIF